MLFNPQPGPKQGFSLESCRSRSFVRSFVHLFDSFGPFGFVWFVSSVSFRVFVCSFVLFVRSFVQSSFVRSFISPFIRSV